MAFDFPALPSEGQLFTPAGGPTYIYHAPAWELQPDANAYVLKTGDTMTGSLQTENFYANLSIVVGNATTAGPATLYFGNSGSQFLTYDGANYQLSGGTGLIVNGGHVMSADGATPATHGTFYFGSNATTWLNCDGANYTFSGGIPVNANRFSASTLNASGDCTANAVIANYVQSNGNMSVAGNANFGNVFTGQVSSSSSVTSSAQVTNGTNPAHYFNDGSTNRMLCFFETAIGKSQIYDTYSGTTFGLDYAAQFTVNTGACGKPGGGVWYDTSDVRIKNVEGDFTRGLDAVAALRPVTYTFKGNDTQSPPSNTVTSLDAASKDPVVVPYKNSSHYLAATSGKRFTGLVAQEVEALFPELVTRKSGYIDGVEVSDIRDIDSTPLIYALVNAVKELKARIEVLEAAG